MDNFLDTLKVEELNEYQKNKRMWLIESNYSNKSNKTFWRMMNSNILFREKANERDLYDFNKKEIVDIIKGITKKQHKQSMFSAINSYMKWACDRQYNRIGNPCEDININELAVVDEELEKETYQTKNEFYEFLEELKCSDVDKMLLVLLRYGVKLNYANEMKWTHIDRDEMKLHVNTPKYLLKLPIDNRFLEHADRCYDCRKYDGFSSDEIKVRPVEYSFGDYIIKNTMRFGNSPDDEQVKIATLYTRLDTISTNNKIVRINPGELNKARKFDFLFKGYELNGIVDSDDVKDVIEMFDGNFTNAKMVKVKNEFETISDVKITKLNYGIVAIQRKRQEKNKSEEGSEEKKIKKIKEAKKDIFG